MDWFIGTSGWTFQKCDQEFYPTGTKNEDKLDYYSSQFNTTEINYSFYHIIQESTFNKWHDKTPNTFRFAIKMHRYITHIKKLNADAASMERMSQFFENLPTLKENMGPILLQLPASIKKNADKLKTFFERLPQGHQYAFEFRHVSWFDEEIKNILREYNAALVIAQSNKFPCHVDQTADFIYARFHGPEAMFYSGYDEAFLRAWAETLQDLAKNAKEGYIYFNNTAGPYPLENAKTIEKLLNR